MAGKRTLAASRGRSMAQLSSGRSTEIEQVMQRPRTLTKLAEKASNAALDAVASAAISTQDKLKKLYATANSANSKTNQVVVDGIGGVGSVLSFEAANWVIRKIGDKLPSMQENIDLWQSVPHLAIGLVLYIGELWTRKTGADGAAPVFAGMPRQLLSEWSKTFALLGMSNLFRALRVRRRDAKKAATELQAANAELERLKARVAELEAKK